MLTSQLTLTAKYVYGKTKYTYTVGHSGLQHIQADPVSSDVHMLTRAHLQTHKFVFGKWNSTTSYKVDLLVGA